VQDSSFEDAINALKRDYIDSLPEKLDSIEQLVMDIATSDTPMELSEQIYRDVHSLKGTAGTYGLQIITNICHELEEQIGKYADDTIDICLQYLDLIRSALEISIQSDNPNFSIIEEKLYDFQKEISDNNLLGLIVDHSNLNTMMVQQILEPYPIKLSHINDGLVALSKLLFTKYDFVIVSKELPSLSGAALLKCIQASNCPNKETKAILMSSTDKMDYVDRGPDKIVIKNNTFDKELPNSIESLFPELGL